MAFRTSGYWKSMVRQLQRSSNFSTPKLKAYAPTADQLHPSPGEIKSKAATRDPVPLCMAVGAMAVSASCGVYTALHQLGRAPNVSLKKWRRETIPEVVEPEQVAEEAEKFVKQSLFRKVAHFLISYPMRGDVFTRPLQLETLKDIGVDPKTAAK